MNKFLSHVFTTTMLNKNIYIVAFIATFLIAGATVASSDLAFAKPPEDKQKKDKAPKQKGCKAKVEVILIGNMTGYQTVKIGDGKEQIKQLEEGETQIKFNYNMNKLKGQCPPEIPAIINGVQYSVPIVGKKNVLEVTL